MNKRNLITALLAIVSMEAMAQTDSTAVKNDSVMWDQSLDGVTVTAQRQLIKQETDRVGYDVQADEDSRTENVLDMLRKVPMLTIDGEENILVKGNSNYKIYKNGHLDPSLTKNATLALTYMHVGQRLTLQLVPHYSYYHNGIGSLVYSPRRCSLRHIRKQPAAAPLAGGGLCSMETFRWHNTRGQSQLYGQPC